ncbi:MAG TPA: UTP--glucose-1-phosphate uridylyltransferase GalU [Gammaproteobacteria bacterium]|nr:UTP--glucose-1-phosphate uridylyltransferase GalU [Gammaproteobacteria bacterium]
MLNITKAVFPVAGLGTRFLPATKANPKEMLTIVDKPLIQYAVEEAVAAGVRELIFVTSSSKRAIEDHFDSNFELESTLQEQGKHALLNIVKGILPEGVSCAYIRQKSPQGLGHAVLCAKPLLMNEAFAVLLADDLIDSTTLPSEPQPISRQDSVGSAMDGRASSCLKQMVERFATVQASIIAVQKVCPEETKKHGIVDVATKDQILSMVRGITEKPAIEHAPSDLGVVGRYILTPAILKHLEKTRQGSGGEIQLTDAIATLLLEEKVYAYRFHGQRYDCGSKLGYLQATVAYALKHPEVADDFKQFLGTLLT